MELWSEILTDDVDKKAENPLVCKVQEVKVMLLRPDTVKGDAIPKAAKPPAAVEISHEINDMEL